MKPWSEALRPLPDFAPPPGGWLDLQRRRRRQAQRRVALGGGLALAACKLVLQLNYADAGGATRLWQDRVALMNQLVHTHQSAAAAARNPSTEPAEEFAI
jgi:hypothetical protein